MAGCWKLRIRVGEGISTLVRSARFSGLLVWPIVTAEGKTDLYCCGPLQVFGKSFVYARGLVSVAMQAMMRYQGEVEIIPCEGSAVSYLLLASDPIAAKPKEISGFDSALEKRCHRLLVKAAGDLCSISREPGCLSLGRSLVIPDFGLSFLDGRMDVLVEVVGFWTGAYLSRKNQLMRDPLAGRLKFMATREIVDKLPGALETLGEGRLFIIEAKVNLDELRAWVLRRLE